MSVSAIASASAEQSAALRDLLLACVRSGAVVGYDATLSPATAEQYWAGTLAAAQAGHLDLLISGDAGIAVVGTVQLVLRWPPNQPHLAGVGMLLVHPGWRRRGVAAVLLRSLEAIAAARGRTLLTLQTARGSEAERLYVRLGYQMSGMIAGYWLDPAGVPVDGVFYCKRIAG